MVTLFSMAASPALGQGTPQNLQCLPSQSNIWVQELSPIGGCWIRTGINNLPANLIQVTWVFLGDNGNSTTIVGLPGDEFGGEGILPLTDCGAVPVTVTMQYSDQPDEVFECVFVGCNKACKLGITSNQGLNPCQFVFGHSPESEYNHPNSTWTYDFGDGTVITGGYNQQVANSGNTTGTYNNPLHTYTQNGIYQINVTYTSPQSSSTCCITVLADCQAVDPCRNSI
jgi:hypothetical protein